MLQYILNRFLSLIPVVILVTFAVFSLLFLAPGDPIRLMIPPDAMDNVSEERLEEMRHELGLDRPIPVQYIDWLWRALHGDLGQSLRFYRPVTELILRSLPVTLELGLLGMSISLIIAIPVGMLSAYRADSLEDVVSSTIALLGLSTPPFFLAIILMLAFAVWLKWLPGGGFVRLSEDPLQNLKYAILPALTMSGSMIALSMRMTRSSFVEVLREDYIVVARAKGLKESAVLLKHAFKNAIIPVITVIGLQTGAVLSSAYIIEWIFGVPGIGKLAMQAIFKRDFPVVQGVALYSTFLFMGVNLVVDVLYAWIDPRIAQVGSSRP